MSNMEIELLSTAIKWLQTITQEDTYDAFLEKVLKFQHFNFDYSRVKKLIDEYDDQIKINFLTTYFLIYIFSEKYPDEIWDENILITLEDYNVKSIEYQRYFDGLKIMNNDIKRHNNDELKIISLNIKGNLVNNLLKVSKFKDYGILETLTNIAIYKDKPGGSILTTPQKWLNMLETALCNVDNISVRNNVGVETKECDLYAVSIKGLDHSKCDDCSNVIKLDDTTWAAFCADGVGSEIKSHIGSELAGKAFIECVKEKHNIFKKHEKYYSKNMMNYIQVELAKDIAKFWQEDVKNHIKGYQEDNETDLEIFDFSSTLLVSFGCKDFIACGMVGDGHLVIEKSPLPSLNEYGYLKMNDCFSDVIQKAVLNVSHLIDNPHLMQFRFFKPEEISSIILASDGANGLFFKSFDEILYPNLEELLNITVIFEKLRKLDFNICKEEIFYLCQKFVQNNRFGGGRGDDCSIVYIRFRR